MQVLKVSFMSFILMLSIGCSRPNAEITPDNRTDECAAEIKSSLEAFVEQSLGVNYQIDDSYPKAIFENATVEIAYGRDGTQQVAHIGLNISSDHQCQLSHYRQDTRRPGESSSTRGNYGSVDLDHCRCSKK